MTQNYRTQKTCIPHYIKSNTQTDAKWKETLLFFLVVQYSWNSQSNPIIFISLADGCTAQIFTVIKYTLLESMCAWMQTVGDRYYVILQDWISFFLFFEKPVTIHNSLQIHLHIFLQISMQCVNVNFILVIMWEISVIYKHWHNGFNKCVHIHSCSPASPLHHRSECSGFGILDCWTCVVELTGFCLCLSCTGEACTQTQEVTTVSKLHKQYSNKHKSCI